MNNLIAKILLKNFIARISSTEDGQRVLPGVVTEDEFACLQFAISTLESPDIQQLNIVSAALPDAPVQIKGEPLQAPITLDTPPKASSAEAETTLVELNTSILQLPSGPSGVRICLDFGTAMSKATLIADVDEENAEEIIVLDLGRPGNQEEVSQTMLISSVYIDNAGLIWFGKAADDMSKIEEDGGVRQRLDNIKRRLSEDGLNEQLNKRLNPTLLNVTYRDMVLAYLTFFTWTVNECSVELGYPRNVPRRYAMPCLSTEKGREVKHELSRLIGEAQILADTFANQLSNGLPLSTFLEATKRVSDLPSGFPYVLDAITEPLGVASSLLNWKVKSDMLAMVIDVGAGTSDLSLYRVTFNPENGVNSAIEANGAARGITEAGNYLDRVLIELILKKAGVTTTHPRVLAIRGKLELSIRDMKETLFNEGSVLVPLDDSMDVEIELDEFCDLEAIRNFGGSLSKAMRSILEEVDNSFIDWVATVPGRYMTVVLTGGGASLPMVRELAQGDMQIGDRIIRLVPALQFPNWLREQHPSLEQDYPRVAVSLGGARRQIIRSEGKANVTAGGRSEWSVGGYYVSG